MQVTVINRSEACAILNMPGDLARQINAFVEYYDHVRYHESIDNPTPADVYFGRAETILAERQHIKLATTRKQK